MENCVSCTEKPRKYKCSKCSAPYCSVACYKVHRDSPECVIGDVSKNTPVNAVAEEPTLYGPFTTDDTVPADKLQQLETSENLCNLLHNPHLRSLLHQIDVALNAQAAMRAAMQEPLFVEFANACLQVVEPMTDEERSEMKLYS
ncbi:zinc finger HIT domain-containing protein 3 [Drosophila kikkawai]|uniref:Zinc finger HIT domain-containing protein 3 n=1 Tax=Drosophila kikkawai TaxID=30033 RepID=A0A6P4JFI2_DROKI|nr:zinc finger HIT domain-containing protein 3 [Drosophila kikkawai]XP_041633124.1 zinc finger HIT domain-containing protein 3 [Drosophila kikkawai]